MSYFFYVEIAIITFIVYDILNIGMDSVGVFAASNSALNLNFFAKGYHTLGLRSRVPFYL